MNEINIVARKRLEINNLTQLKLPDPPPFPRRIKLWSSLFCCKCVSSVSFAWGVLRGVFGEYALRVFMFNMLILSKRVVVVQFSKLMQCNAHKTGRAPVLHIKKWKDHFDTYNAHFIFAQFLIILHLCKKSR